MTKYEYKYFQFPLCMLQKVHENTQEGFNEIISFSLMNFANKLPDEPPEGLNDWQIENYDEVDKLEIASSILGLTLGTKSHTRDRHRKALAFIQQKETVWGTYPWPGIKTAFIFDVRDRNNPDETALIAALIGIKSLIGQRRFTATHKSVILCRMIGCKRNDELTKTLAENPVLKAVHDRYSTRRRFDRLIQRLLERGFIRSKISYGRQVFLSDTLDYSQLETAIVDKLKKRMFADREKASRTTIKSKLHE